MHALRGLQQLGLTFELKGGTSSSNGYGLIHRFSEDIDILIHPEGALPVGRNQNKPAQVAARRAFYDDLAAKIAIPGFRPAERDTDFDDVGYFRRAGIRVSPARGSAVVAGGACLQAWADALGGWEASASSTRTVPAARHKRRFFERGVPP
jgi:hypothetical protein